MRVINWKCLVVLIAFGTLAFVWAVPGHAEFIDVQFSESSSPAAQVMVGSAAVGSAGDYWNYVSNISSGPVALNGVDDLASGVSLTFSPAPSYTGNSFADTTLPLYQESLFLQAAGYQNWAPPATTLTLTGLVPDQPYDLYLYAGSAAALTFGGTTLDTADGADISSYSLGGDYQKFTVTADGLGTISGTWATAGADEYSVLNGLQIAPHIAPPPVPEPSTLALLAAALLAPLGCVFRKRK